ncbi:MAG: SelL-related redox protein [Phycisphaerales bacterium]
MRPLLIFAGCYNLVWGGLVILFPTIMFEKLGLQPPRYNAIWQCVGMIVGVYGVGYLIASSNPYKHWPIILVGLLGKIFGPIGFVYAALITKELPASFGWVLIPNDLIWWVPFGLILYQAARYNQLPEDARYEPARTVNWAIEHARDQHGITIFDRSVSNPVLVVFLRHLGCTFCLQTLQDLQSSLPELRMQDVEPVIVHMSDDQSARDVLLKYGLENLPRVSDPKQSYYQAFELSRGSFLQLFGPRTWIEGIKSTLRGNIVSGLKGDGFQMPGAFIIEHGRMIQSFRHRSAGERLNYSSMICGIDPVAQPVATKKPLR